MTKAFAMLLLTTFGVTAFGADLWNRPNENIRSLNAGMNAYWNIVPLE